MNTEQELLDYAVKMRTRGDTYRSMLGYLQSKSNDEELIGRIITKVDELEKEKVLRIDEVNPKRSSNLTFTMGLIFFAGGVFLLFFLWGKGWVSTIPFGLMAIGLAALTGMIK